ncbi:hypothetical protein [Haloferula sp. A504]|uniref:hypothetical protein n=1 Tax=Haloferula sp. A504 TaxID=3373601 RepID=UPI0031C02771|nr:hypothetical protein [Verrucomicrobiaceae bacterium E54]
MEAGWASKHVWRGIDVAQFTSFNHLVPGNPLAEDPDSDITFVGVNATYKGFALGLKYIESLDDGFNPFYAPLLTTKDSYSELILSANYTRMLVGEDWLQGTFGFDFYYYPNGEFWGVEHQGMVYANFVMPRYSYAQPFLNLWYNVPTTTDGQGLANNPAFRGTGGADLVEGWGGELGVMGSRNLYSNDQVGFGLSYSVSTIYKSGYQFESDGFTHVAATLGAPVTIGDSFVVSPSITYVEALEDVPPTPTLGPNSGRLASEWNEPGWYASLRASWTF